MTSQTLLLRHFSTGNASDIVVNVKDFPPGEYNLTVSVHDENGLTGIAEVDIQLSGINVCYVCNPEKYKLQCTESLLVLFNCTLGSEGVTALCLSSLDQTMVPITYTCSYDNGSQENCE